MQSSPIAIIASAKAMPAGDRDRDREDDPGDRDEDPPRPSPRASGAGRGGGRRRARGPLLGDGRVVEFLEVIDRAVELGGAGCAAPPVLAVRRTPSARPEPAPALGELGERLPRRPRGRSRARARRGRRAPSRRTARAGSWRSAARRWSVSGGRGRASRARRGDRGTPPRSSPWKLRAASTISALPP